MGAWNYILNLFSRLGSSISSGLYSALPDWAAYIVIAVIEVVIILGFVLTVTLVFTWAERRLVGRLQARMGPNRVGPFGLLQPVADALKILIKEDIVPQGADRLMFNLAPVLAVFSALAVFAVIPFGRGMIFRDLNIGILYVVAFSSLSTMSIFLAGWASNNKYSLLGAMRAVAQLVSYEIPMILALLGVVVAVGSLQMGRIVEEQRVPFFLLQPLGFLIFLAGATAELNRTPFDLPEAESEMAAGFHTEYSGMKFIFFYLAEYVNTLAVGGVVATLFLGGWKGPVLPSYVWFIIKFLLFFFLLLWLRGTLPRVRIDQVMAFAWKFLLPLALINLFIVGAEVVLWDGLPWPVMFLNMALAVVLIVGWANLIYGRSPSGVARLPLGEKAR